MLLLHGADSPSSVERIWVVPPSLLLHCRVRVFHLTVHLHTKHLLHRTRHALHDALGRLDDPQPTHEVHTERTDFVTTFIPLEVSSCWFHRAATNDGDGGLRVFWSSSARRRNDASSHQTELNTFSALYNSNSKLWGADSTFHFMLFIAPVLCLMFVRSPSRSTWNRKSHCRMVSMYLFLILINCTAVG